MSNDINRLRELAGIKQEPVKNKTKKLDEGVLGSMQEVRHVSEREHPLDYSEPEMQHMKSRPGSIDGKTGRRVHGGNDTGYEEEDDIFSRGERVPYDDDELEHEFGMHDYDGMFEDAPPGMEDWIKSNKERFKKQYGKDWEEVLYATAWKMKNNESIGESELDNFSSEVDEDMLKNKEDKIKDEAQSMIARGMDPDSVIMALADEYGLSTEEQFNLYNVVVQHPVAEDDDQETMRGRQPQEQGDTEESHTVDWEEVKNAAAEAAESIFGNVDQEALDGIINDTKRDVDDYANTEDAVQIAINKMRQNESSEGNNEIEEDFDNGYDSQVDVDADGYFPRGAHNAVNDDAGPSSAKHGDNPMQKKMDVAEGKSIHRSLVSGYRLSKKS